MFKTLIIAAAIAFTATGSAFAASMCAERAEMVKTLAVKYGESQVMLGVAGNSVLETWANMETTTWTVIITRPNGQSCLQAAGDGFGLIVPEAKSTSL